MSGTKAFKCLFAAAEEHTVAAQGCSFRAHIDFKEAHKRLKEFDVVIVPGGGTPDILKAKSEPLGIIKAFAELQKKDSARERTLMSICTGSLFLAQVGILQGLAATTHPDCYTKLENICKEAALRDMADRTDVMEERYVVNNGRFDIGDDDEDNPYITRKGKRALSRKGSNAWKESKTRRESITRRQSMRLGGLRVITSGGVTSGLDASMYLVSAMVSNESAQEVGRILQYTWNKGVVVDAIDI